jgi:hypothetical protein
VVRRSTSTNSQLAAHVTIGFNAGLTEANMEDLVP